MTIRADDLTKSIPVSAFQTTSSKSRSFYSRYGKRAFDLVAVLSTAVFVVPIVLVLALLVALDTTRFSGSAGLVGTASRSDS